MKEKDNSDEFSSEENNINSKQNQNSTNINEKNTSSEE